MVAACLKSAETESSNVLEEIINKWIDSSSRGATLKALRPTNAATLEANCKRHIWTNYFICNEMAFSLCRFYFFFSQSKIVVEQIPRALQFHRAAKFSEAARARRGTGKESAMMCSSLAARPAPASFLFAIPNSRHAGRCARSDSDALNWSLRHDEFPSQISVTARPERATDLKPATRCVLNKQRGKKGSPWRGVVPAFYSNCVCLCCCPAARNYLFEPLAFQRCCTNTGVHKKMVTFPSLL